MPPGWNGTGEPVAARSAVNVFTMGWIAYAKPDLPRALSHLGRAVQRDPKRYLLHARQELMPGRGEGLREAAAARTAPG